MCGIFYAFHNGDERVLAKEGLKIKHRGPDNMTTLKSGKHYFMFHRLCINDLSSDGNQPFDIDDCILICNGEIYNSKELNDTYGFKTKSKSDCETIIHAYRQLSKVCEYPLHLGITLQFYMNQDFYFQLC